MVQYLPLIENKANQVKSRIRRGVRLGVPIVAGGVLIGWLYMRAKRRQIEAEVAKLHSDVNVRNAMLYVESIKPPGLIMRLISKTVIGDVLKVAEVVKGWFGMSETDQVLEITDRVVDWAATVKSYRILTGGRTLNRDLQRKLGGDYPKFVDRLARNTNAVDVERRRRENETVTQMKADSVRLIIMKIPPGVILPVNDPKFKNVKLTAKRDGILLFAEPAHKKVGRVQKAGTYIGRPSNRFMNHANKDAMVEIVTSNGLAWAEFNDLTVWTSAPSVKQ